MCNQGRDHQNLMFSGGCFQKRNIRLIYVSFGKSYNEIPCCLRIGARPYHHCSVVISFSNYPAILLSSPQVTISILLNSNL